MNNYLVTRWGNDNSPDGPDGEDTNFIVWAKGRDDAAMIVDEFLSNVLPHENVHPFCHVIIELGADNSSFKDSEIIFGPWYAFAQIKRYGYTVWQRESNSNEDWIESIPLKK